jgi:hypothetical protein
MHVQRERLPAGRGARRVRGDGGDLAEVSASLLATSDVIRAALVPPPTPAAKRRARDRARAPPLRHRPDEAIEAAPVARRATATVGERTKRDVDRLVLQCACPVGPPARVHESRRRSARADARRGRAGTDLDNG